MIVEQKHRWVRVSVQSGWVQGRLIQRKVSHGRRRFLFVCFNVTSFLFNPLHAVLFFLFGGYWKAMLFLVQFPPVSEGQRPWQSSFLSAKVATLLAGGSDTSSLCGLPSNGVTQYGLKDRKGVSKMAI